MPRRSTQTEYLGLTEEAGIALAESKGMLTRVVRRNGLPEVTDMNLRSDRVSFEVTDGKIVNAEIF